MQSISKLGKRIRELKDCLVGSMKSKISRNHYQYHADDDLSFRAQMYVVASKMVRFGSEQSELEAIRF